MRTDDSIFLIYNHRNSSNVFKMTKAKTAMVLVMIIFSCGLIFAYPASEAPEETQQLTNTSRLVITHVVKTIEFEVGIVDDAASDENATDADGAEFYETDIQLLNVDLLKEVVNQATGEETSEKTMEQQTTAEGKTEEQMPNNSSLLPLNQTTS